MGRKNLYKYYCITEDKFIKEAIEVNNPAPNKCKNDHSHTVDWTTLTIYYKAPKKEDIGLDDIENIKNKKNAPNPPTIDDDKDKNYSIGSKWFTNDDEIYLCIDNRKNNAVWEKITEQITISNIGSSGVGIYKTKTNENIKLKKLDAGSSKLSIIDNTSNDKIDIDINEENIAINNLSGAPSGQIVGIDDEQILTNKIINGVSNTITISADNVISGTFANERIASSNITQHEEDININNLSGKPNGGLVGTTEAQTLTNKTLVSPILDAPILNSPTFSSITNNGNIITIPDQSCTIIGHNTNDILTSKTWGDDLNMNNNKITNVGTPTADLDVANKIYVDNMASGIDVKDSVVVATIADLGDNNSIAGSPSYDSTAGTNSRGQLTAILDVANIFTIDNVSFNSHNNGSRILLKNQSNASQNGIWTINISGTNLTLDRASDFNSDSIVSSGAFMFVEKGTINANSGWILTTNDPITIGGSSGTDLTFAQFSGAGQIIAGTGMNKFGNTLNVVGSSTIIANSDNIQVNSNNNAHQPLLSSGTIGNQAIYGPLPLGNNNSVSGILPVNKGGTGALTFPTGHFLQGNGTGAITASKMIPVGMVVGTSDIQTLTNKTINTNYNTINVHADDIVAGTLSDNLVKASNVVQHERLINIENLVNAPISQVVGVNDSQTLLNKTLVEPKIKNTSNEYKYTLKSSDLTNNRTITLPPLIDHDTFVFEDHIQTLTNKIINSNNNNITISASDITFGTFADDRISQSSVKQHESSLDHDNLSGYVEREHLDWTLDQNSYNIHKNNITQDSVTQHQNAININNLLGSPNGSVIGTTDAQILKNKTIDTNFNVLTIKASDVSSGTFDDARIKSSSIVQHENDITISNLIGAPNGQVVGTNDVQTLTNKTLVDLYTFFQDNENPSKKMQFQLANLSNNSTRTLTIPDANTTLVGTNVIQTLTNKTINSVSNNIILQASNITSGTFANARISKSSVVQYASDIDINDLLNAPSGNVVGTSDAQILTNKTITSNDNILALDANVLISGSLPNGRISVGNITQHVGSINHNSLLNYVHNQHIDHSQISILSGNGLSGGGNLVSTRTLSLDIDGLELEPNPDSSNDYLVIYDTSSSTHKKILLNSISSSGNTATNIGKSGVGIFKQKTDSNLEFKKVASGSTKISIVDNNDFGTVDFDLVEAQINHDNLLGFIAYEHVNHSKVLINTGSGLSGGGDITQSRTIDIDIINLKSDEAPDSATDYVMTFDSSANGLKKVLLKNLPSKASSMGLKNLIDTNINIALKGDILVNDGSKWMDLSLGLDEQVLTVDTTQPSGVKWDYTFGSQKAFSAYDSIGGTTVTSGAIVSINAITKNTGQFSLVNDIITVNDESTFLISFQVSTQIHSGSSRSVSYCWLERDTGSGFVEVIGTRGWMYNRTVGNSAQSCSRSIVLDTQSGDQFRLSTNIYTGNDTIKTIANGSSITFIAIGGNGKNGTDGVDGQIGKTGPQGPAGPAGSGVNINVINNNRFISGSPFEALNFIGGVVCSQNVRNSKIVDINLGPTHYGSSETDPVGTFRAGDKYFNSKLNEEMFWDASRKKWLSVSIRFEGSGLNGNTREGLFYKRFNGMSLSHTLGPYVPKGTIVEIGFGTDNAVHHTYEILVGGIVIAELTSNGAAEAYSNTINSDFDGGKMSSRNKVGSETTNYFQGYVGYRLRA